MKINGREIKFMFNILASIEVASLCKDGSLENIGGLFDGPYEQVVKNNNAFIIALHRGYIEAQKEKDPNFDEEVITERELLLLDNQEYLKLQNEAYSAYYGDSKREVNTEPVKTKGKKTGTPKKSS